LSFSPHDISLARKEAVAGRGKENSEKGKEEKKKGEDKGGGGAPSCGEETQGISYC